MNTPHTIQSGVTYVHKMDHRDGSKQKSQWTISEDDERSAFSRTYSEEWYDGSTGWGLHFDGNTIGNLGFGVDRIRPLFMAKFVDGNARSEWHGYPADYLEHQQDVPDTGYLMAWCEEGHLSRAKMRKILQRKPCNL